MSGTTLIKTAFLALVMFALACNIYAIPPDSAYKKIPQLNGHTFIPLVDANNPFINTHLKIGVGVAISEPVEYATLTIDGKDLYSLVGNILMSDVGLGYQQKIKSWLAIYFNFRFASRFGTQLSSLYAEGVNMVSGYDVGWLIKIHESKRHALSGHVQLSDYRANILHLDRLILNVIEDTIIATSENVPALLGVAGLRYVFAPNDLFGFGISGDFGFGESFDRGVTQVFGKINFFADIDLYNRTGVPLGLSAKYSNSSLPATNVSDDNQVSVIGMKLAYTGGNDYMFGIESSWLQLPSEANANYTNALFISIQFHLYF
jgi:hypothetical protein